MNRFLFSGIALLTLHLFQGHVGVVSALDCIQCTWNPMNTSNACVSKPYEQPTEGCPETSNNVRYVCETRISYKMSGDTPYLETVSRQCEQEHAYCNQECVPTKNTMCYFCCNNKVRCNSFSLGSSLLPVSMYYNVTTNESSTIEQTPLGLFMKLLITITSLLIM